MFNRKYFNPMYRNLLDIVWGGLAQMVGVLKSAQRTLVWA